MAHSTAEETGPSHVRWVMQRQMECRANEKKKDLGVDELLRVGREWSSGCVESTFPGGSEGFGPADCDVT